MTRPAPKTLTARASQPDARECAMLIAHLLATKGREVDKDVTRARLAEVTLRRLFCRRRIRTNFLLEVQEWLLGSGWVLFWAGSTYAVVKTKIVDGWGRVSSKRISGDLHRVQRGQFNFENLEAMLLVNPANIADEEV
jgi:hypothetical protein